MKNFKNVFRTLSSNKSVTCAYHNESKLPFLRPLGKYSPYIRILHKMSTFYLLSLWK